MITDYTVPRKLIMIMVAIVLTQKVIDCNRLIMIMIVISLNPGTYH